MIICEHCKPRNIAMELERSYRSFLYDCIETWKCPNCNKKVERFFKKGREFYKQIGV